MRVALALASIVALCSCDTGKFTVDQTAKVLLRAQPSLQQEADYEMAKQAIPGALKTVEGFWIVSPENENLIKILTEGYCQYGTAFVEDDWEIAKFKKDLEAIEYHNDRATHIFTRCLNYALKQLGGRWQKELFADTDKVAKLIKDTGEDDRNAMMFAGLALGSLVNHNLTRVEMIAYLPTVKLIIGRVLELDAKHKPSNTQYAALPWVAMGMIYTGASVSFGGDPKLGREAFEMALKASADKDHPDGRFLLARTLMAYRVGIQTNDRKFFHDQLKKVLETPPSVWPEQRLANEVAHRRARRYLSHEKDLFQ